jgi:uncharacterized membrane protein
MYMMVGAGSVILAMIGQMNVMQLPIDMLISQETAASLGFVVFVVWRMYAMLNAIPMKKICAKKII